MREILYRGFHPCKNGTEKVFIDGKWIKGEWVYGYYIRYGWTHQEKNYIVPSYASDLYAKEVIHETVGQYTGLTDKNGKKIFEGDIVQSIELELKGIIVFDEHCRFMIKDLTTGSTYLISYNNDEIKVIGNIHDNPELMEGA